MGSTLNTLLADLDRMANEMEAALEERGISTGPARQLRAVGVGIRHAITQKEKREEEAATYAPLLVSAEDVWGSCGKKRRYKTLAAAGRAATDAKAKGSTDELRVYQCFVCDGGYHLTHVALERLAR